MNSDIDDSDEDDMEIDNGRKSSSILQLGRSVVTDSFSNELLM